MYVKVYLKPLYDKHKLSILQFLRSLNCERVNNEIALWGKIVP